MEHSLIAWLHGDNTMDIQGAHLLWPNQPGQAGAV